MKETLLLLIMFWNLENYFDPFNNQTDKDIDFTPNGSKMWTWNKFIKKRDAIAKTIILSASHYQTYPAIIGLCEIENRFVLEHLVEKSALASLDYKIIHKESNDSRGIDIAMLYNAHIFSLLKTSFFKVGLSDSSLNTRDILYAKLLYSASGDTIHCLVNHWPSKLGGEKISLKRRMSATFTLNKISDSILFTNPKSIIIAMGDFNDSPHSKPIKSITNLYNLSPYATSSHTQSVEGSYKYKEKWERIDQFLISPTLSNSVNTSLKISSNGMQIFSHPLLLLPDKKYLGFKPFRSTLGPQYLGGISDHLPIMLELVHDNN